MSRCRRAGSAFETPTPTDLSTGNTRGRAIRARPPNGASSGGHVSDFEEGRHERRVGRGFDRA